MNLRLKEQLYSVFRSHFGTEPVMFFSPGRINLIGEHTDYNQGYVMPAAIDRGIILCIGYSFVSDSTLISAEFDQRISFDINRPEINPSNWTAYVMGVIKELKHRAGHLPQLNLVLGSDLPMGSGLSSSAALENAVSFGMNKFLDLGLERAELARIGQATENDHLGLESGIMDQFAGLFGREDHLLLLDCGSLNHEYIRWDNDDLGFLLIDTKVSRRLAHSAYNDRKQSCSRVAAICGMDSLRGLDLERLLGFKDKLSEEDFRLAKYVIEENERVLMAAHSIRKRNFRQVGLLMKETHSGLRNDYRVSCEELDFLVENTEENDSVLGARMMGGGFGGCTINLVKTNSIEDFGHRMSTLYNARFGKNCKLHSVNLSSGVCQIL